MKPKKIKTNKHFIGRHHELQRLTTIAERESPAIIIVYGRRRVGKTELLEQAFKSRKILKFEGIQGQSEDIQRKMVMQQLAEYSANPLINRIEPLNWLDVFRFIYSFIETGEWTLYFEELQWLAHYNDSFISELKYAWDNYFRYNEKLILILCGSSPSFMINHVVHSKSLYNRSQHEFHLQEFSLHEAQMYLKAKMQKEVMMAYLTVGGIPEYLNRLKDNSSVYLSLCQNSFVRNSYFSQEFQRIFVSSLSENVYYKKIIEFLSKNKFSTRDDILKKFDLKSGGRISVILLDLEACGFIYRYTPYNTEGKSILVRYAIKDNYLHFFYKFIKPKLTSISQGRYDNSPTEAIKLTEFHQWLGYSFERFCRFNHHKIARILGFSAVQYHAGSFFNKTSIKQDPLFQIDLLFDRDDHVITVCEIKFIQKKVGTSVIQSFERKIELLPNKKNKTIHKVLITYEGADQALINAAYFDEILTLADFFRS